MIVGNRRTGAFLLVLAMALLLGFITVIWFNRKKTPTPTPEPPMHTALSGAGASGPSSVFPLDAHLFLEVESNPQRWRSKERAPRWLAL